MAEKSPWKEIEGTIAQTRSLETECPPLKSYLHSGTKVLDVGCGPGPITLDVAKKVNPGSVVGIDLGNKMIQKARESTENSQVKNVTFQVGDASSLEFSEDTFDVAYSLNMLVFHRDPVKALQEQKRVTKRGGWVLAGIGDWGAQVIYPPCPAWEKVYESFAHLNDPSDENIFLHGNLGREVVALFKKAGFEEIKVEGYVVPAMCVYQGSEHFEYCHKILRVPLDVEGALSPLMKKLHEKLKGLGVLDEETLLSAQGEVEAWSKDPHAFFAEPAFLGVGRVD